MNLIDLNKGILDLLEIYKNDREDLNNIWI